MGSMRNWILGAAVVAGAAAMGAAPAQAAEFGIYARGPVAYIPPCPGAGYVWIAGYMADGYWIPGRWEFRGFDRPFFGARYERFDGFRGRDWDHDRDRRWDRDRDRGFRDRDRDHDRGFREHERFRR